MRNVNRLKNTFAFKETDRLPVIEWAPWWDKTVERWRGEGLPAGITGTTDIMAYFGLDVHKQFWYGSRSAACPPPPAHGMGVIGELDADAYIKLKENGCLYPAGCVNAAETEMWAAKQRNGEAFVWISLDGFFWHPRTIMGIENHLYAFYDAPELMHMMNQDLLEYNIKVLDEFCKICVPDFMTFAEDMSYNHGPMLSEAMFGEFVAPYYKQIVPRLNEYGIQVIIDSDGDIHKLVPWFETAGVNGFLPLERQAGVDINELRRTYPRLRILGGFDKMVMNRGEEAIRSEFERIMPVMRQGGFIPSCDHQTPPGVSMEDYRLYVRLLNEYCRKAAA